MLFPAQESLLSATPSNLFWRPTAANIVDLLYSSGRTKILCQTATAQNAFMKYWTNLNSISVTQKNWRSKFLSGAGGKVVGNRETKAAEIPSLLACCQSLSQITGFCQVCESLSQTYFKPSDRVK